MCNEPLISVIIPVFNVENFLKECIESVLNQTMSQLQIILVDDGSSDSSGLICDQYAKKDSRIEVIHQKNYGVSVARNVGLQLAKGKYISFVDSDDILAVQTYQIFFNNWKNDTELIIGRMQMISETGDILGNIRCRCFSLDKISSMDFMIDLFEEKRFSYLGYLCDKLFLREVIMNNNIQFNSLIKLNEDRLFILQYLCYIKNITLSNDIVYYYRQRNQGTIIQSRRNCTVSENEMTVLTSFIEMKKICRKYSEKLFYICSRKAFESALDLLKRVSKRDKEKHRQLLRFLWENSLICMKNPSYSYLEKLKIFAHATLRR